MLVSGRLFRSSSRVFAPEERYLASSLRFIDEQRISGRSVEGRKFDGLYQSYLHNPRNPNSRYIAQYGRVWVYDQALGIYADLYAGRTVEARAAVDALVGLADFEAANGYRGCWHFSYNTRDDGFIDPRGPLGSNLWAFSAIYTYILRSGDTRHLAWANSQVTGYVFDQQVLDKSDRRYGLFRAGLENPADLARGDGMGYHVYESVPSDMDRLLEDNQRLSQQILGVLLPHPLNRPVAALEDLIRRVKPIDQIINSQVDFCSIEHNADAIVCLRLAARATKRYLPSETAFLSQLACRHQLAMEALPNLWVVVSDGTGHFVTGMNGDGTLNTSLAVDNNTWVPAILLGFDDNRVWDCIRFTRDTFLTTDAGCKGLYFFTRDFQDRYVQLSAAERAAMERMIQPECTFGYIHLLWMYSRQAKDAARRDEARQLAAELARNMVAFQALYARTGDPYERGAAGFSAAAARLGLSTIGIIAGEPRATLRVFLEEGQAAANRHCRFGTPYCSVNMKNYFNTLESMASTATGAVVISVMLHGGGDDFITVEPPAAFMAPPYRPVLHFPDGKGG